MTFKLKTDCLRHRIDGFFQISTKFFVRHVNNNEENRGRNRYNVEMFLCAYYISAGQTHDRNRLTEIRKY